MEKTCQNVKCENVISKKGNVKFCSVTCRVQARSSRRLETEDHGLQKRPRVESSEVPLQTTQYTPLQFERNHRSEVTLGTAKHHMAVFLRAWGQGPVSVESIQLADVTGDAGRILFGCLARYFVTDGNIQGNTAAQYLSALHVHFARKFRDEDVAVLRMEEWSPLVKKCLDDINLTRHEKGCQIEGETAKMTFQDYYLMVEFLVRCGSPESIQAACAIAWATMCSGRCSDVANIKQTPTNPVMTDRKLIALKPFQPKVRQVKQLVMAARMNEFELDVLLLWIYHIALSGPLALDSDQEAPLFPNASTERESRTFFKKWLDFAIAGLRKENKGQLLTPQLTPHSLRNLVWQMVLRHRDCNVEAGSKHAGWEKRNHQGAREKYSGFNEEQEDRVARCAVGCIDLSRGGEFPELMPVSLLKDGDIHWETYEFARLLTADNFHRINPSMVYAGAASVLSNYQRMKTKFGSDHVFIQLPLRVAGRIGWSEETLMKIGEDLDKAWILKQVESVDVAVIDSTLGLSTGQSEIVLKTQGSLLHSLQVLETQNKVITHQLAKLDQFVSSSTDTRQAGGRQFAPVNIEHPFVEKTANTTSTNVTPTQCTVASKDSSVCRIPVHWPLEITSLNKMSISKLWIAWHAEGLRTGSLERFEHEKARALGRLRSRAKKVVEFMKMFLSDVTHVEMPIDGSYVTYAAWRINLARHAELAESRVQAYFLHHQIQ